RRVSVSVGERVEAKNGQPLGLHTIADHQLILAVYAAGLELIDVFIDAIWANACASGCIISSRFKRIYIFAQKFVYATRIDVGDRSCRELVPLTFDSDRSLHIQ